MVTPDHPTERPTKKELRTRLRAQRREIAASRDRAADDAALAREVLAIVDELGLGAGTTVTLYEATPVEPPTAATAAALAERGIRVLVPVTLPNLDLDWCVLDDRPLEERETLGLAAIGQAQLVLMPGLAVDARRTRLGQGGGCYDKALARSRPDAPRITLLHPGELSPEPLPLEEHDQPVDGALSAEGRLV